MDSRRRREPRIAKVLPVKLWGLDGKGKPVIVSTYTIDISDMGARLQAVPYWTEPGEIVAMGYGSAKARYKITWVGKPGTPREGQIGLECIEPAKRLFAAELSQAAAAAAAGAGEIVLDHQEPVQPKAVPPTAYRERRRHPRYRVNGGARVRRLGEGAWQWAVLRDISISGCYIKTFSPMPVNSPIEVQLIVGEQRTLVSGIVRSIDIGVGMGIEFAESGEIRNRIKLLVDSINGGAKY